MKAASVLGVARFLLLLSALGLTGVAVYLLGALAFGAPDATSRNAIAMFLFSIVGAPACFGLWYRMGRDEWPR